MGNKLLPTTLSHHPVIFKSRVQKTLNLRKVSFTVSSLLGVYFAV